MNAEKLKPIHPGEVLLEEFLRPTGVSQNQLALAVRVAARRINEIVHGKQRVTADTALSLARYFNRSDRVNSTNFAPIFFVRFVFVMAIAPPPPPSRSDCPISEMRQYCQQSSLRAVLDTSEEYGFESIGSFGYHTVSDSCHQFVSDSY